MKERSRTLWGSSILLTGFGPVGQALGVMYLAGFSLNNMTLMALVIASGFVVDDAIVVIGLYTYTDVHTFGWLDRDKCLYCMDSVSYTHLK